METQYNEDELVILKTICARLAVKKIERPIPTALLDKLIDYHMSYMSSSDEFEMIQDIYCDGEGHGIEETTETWNWLQQLMTNMLWNYFNALQAPSLTVQNDQELDDEGTIDEAIEMITETIDDVVDRKMPAELWWVPVENIIARIVQKFGKDTLVRALRVSMADADNGWADDEIDWLETTLQEELTPSAKKNKQGGSDIAGI
jgi:hypothetical protein